MVTAAEVAEKTGYVLSGDPGTAIRGIAYADAADEGVVAVAFSPREIASTRSNVVLSGPYPDFSGRTFIFSHEPLDTALVKVAEVLIQAGICPDYSRVSSRLEPRGRSLAAPSSIVGKSSELRVGCVIHEDVSIGERCSIGAYTEIFPGTAIGDDVRIGSGCSIGAGALFRTASAGRRLFCGVGGVRIGDGVSIGNHVTIQRGVLSDTVIGGNTIIGNLIDIAHDVTVGADCCIISQTGIAGNVSIGDDVTVYGQSGIVNRVRIGDHATVFCRSLVTRNVKDFQRVSGAPAFDHRAEMACAARIRRNFNKE